MSRNPFQKDPIFFDQNRLGAKHDHGLLKALTVVAISLILAGVMLAMTTIVAEAENGSTASDRPDWQADNTIQNMFENYNAWLAYTRAIDEEIGMSMDADLTTALIGESLAVTFELYAHMDTEEYPDGKCASDFWHLWSSDLDHWMHFYAGWYHNMTAETGEPIDVDYIVNTYGEWTDWAFSDDGAVGLKCWAKLDT